MKTADAPNNRRWMAASLVVVFALAMFVVPRVGHANASQALGLDQVMSSDAPSGSQAVSSPTFSTVSGNELAVAFVNADGPASSAQSIASVSGAGLTWTRVVQSNAQPGTAEVWQAYSTAQISNAAITATPGVGGYPASITVATFSNAQSAVGATSTANATSGAPSVSLKTTAVGSWVWALGNDWDNGVARTPSSGQTVVHQNVDTAVGNSFWVQHLDAMSTASGQTSTVSDTAPTADRWDMAAVEIVPAQTTAPVTTTTTVAVPTASSSLWSATARPAVVTPAADHNSVELGTRFTATANGSITGVRFYKGTYNTGTHVGNLWSNTGTLLASGKFTSETASGWQQMTFSKPILVAAGFAYVVSYFAPAGNYCYTSSYFKAKSVTAPGLYAPPDGTKGLGNGVYRYGTSSAFPSSSYNATNYWVDVTFQPSGGTPPPSTTTVPPSTTSTTVPVTTTTIPVTTTTRPVTTTTAPVTTTTLPVTTTTQPPSTTWPGPTNTGVPAGTTLTPHSGTWYVTTPNAVIDAMNINGEVVIEAPNVTISRSHIHGTDPYGVYVNYNVPNASVVIKDSEIDGFGEGIAFGSWTCVRCNIHGVSDDGTKVGSDVTLQDSWIHDFNTTPGNHADGSQMQSGSTNLTIRHDYIDGTGPNSAMNSALFICPDLGPTSKGPVTIDDNLLGGGNATVYLLDGSNGQYTQSGVSVTNNSFINNAQYMPADIVMTVPYGWSGNVWNGTTQAVG